MKPELKNAFDTEMAMAYRCYRKSRLHQAFKHLETAHVLGQRYVVPHVQTHWLMLKIGLRRRSTGEVVGQTIRIVLGALGSVVGVVPAGNTGGTDIGMFKGLPVNAGTRTLVERE
jgi:hypothetical protein